MSVAVGIVGLPNVGKTTLFNALTQAGALVANYAFSTVEPNVAIVDVPDERLEPLVRIYRPKKVTPTTIHFLDVAGLVEGASQGAGMGNRFLSHIRDAHALAMVVRCFADRNVPHVSGQLDPRADIATVKLELILADLEVLGRRRERIATAARVRPEGEEREELALVDRLQAHRNGGKSVRTMSLEPEEARLIRGLSLLTAKPLLYVANVSEADIGKEGPELQQVREVAGEEGADVVALSARLEAELCELPEEERRAFLADAGLEEPALNPFIRAAYHLLDLVTFFTGNENEVHAWTVHRDTPAREAAGEVHTDFQRGFIRAEVVACDDLLRAGSYAGAREQGRVRLEGKDYVIADGDVVLFRFSG